MNLLKYLKEKEEKRLTIDSFIITIALKSLDLQGYFHKRFINFKWADFY